MFTFVVMFDTRGSGLQPQALLALRPPPLCFQTLEGSLALQCTDTSCPTALDFCPFQLPTHCLCLLTLSVRSPSLSWSVFKGNTLGFLGSDFLAPVLGTHIVDHLETANHSFLGIEAGANFLALGWCQVPSPGWCLPVLFHSGRFFCIFCHGNAVPVTFSSGGLGEPYTLLTYWATFWLNRFWHPPGLSRVTCGWAQ